MDLPRHARGAFTVDTQVATPAEWHGGAMSHTRLVKTFTGEMAGSGVVESIMLKIDDGGPAAYVGLELIDCTLEHRRGTFVLLHSATARGSEQAGSWTIVPGSGTGELHDIRGRFQILEDHAFVLDYDLDG